MDYIKVPFSSVPIGTEFWWGGFTQERSNWGRKMTTRTADWRPKLSGELAEFVSRGYFRKDEVVFISNN